MPRVFDYQHGFQDEHKSFSKYIYDDGCEVIPLCKPASAGAPHYVVVQMHAPIGIREHEGFALKSGTPPVMPAPNNTPSGDRLLTMETTVVAPDTTATRSDQRIYAGMWRATYAQGCAPVLESGPVRADEQLPGVARGAVYNTAGARRPYRLQSGRPGYARLPLDGAMAASLGLVPALDGPLGGLVTDSIIYQTTQALDFALDRYGRDDTVASISGNFTELAVDYRPNYFTDGLIR